VLNLIRSSFNLVERTVCLDLKKICNKQFMYPEMTIFQIIFDGQENFFFFVFCGVLLFSSSGQYTMEWMTYTFFFWWYWGLNSGSYACSGPLPLEPLHQPFYFCDEFFRERVLWTICPGWLRTVILLISASWVARITDVNHWHLV
jgi:hypothetical protein